MSAPSFFRLGALLLAACTATTDNSGGNAGSGGATATGGGAGGVTATGGGGGNPAASGGASGTGGILPEAGAPDTASDVVDAADTGGTAPDTAAPQPRGQAGGDCPSGVTFPDPVPAGATATLVKGGFVFTEGPAWVASEKALFFTEFGEDGGTGRIHRYAPANGMFSVFFDGPGVNGLAVDERGGLVGASHGLAGITRFDLATRMRVPIAGGDMYQGKKFNSPNDVVVRADGNIYFTDPTYQRPAGSPGQGVTAVYHWKSGTITRHAAGPQPNAIGISIDGKWLYVTSVMAPPVRKFPLADDGSVGEGTTFVDAISQGFAIDCAGNVYLTSNKQVRVYSPAGEPRGTIGGFPLDLTNLAFGDEDRKTLYITARPGSLYKVRLQVPGYPN